MKVKNPKAPAVKRVAEEVGERCIIVVAFGALCFGCGYLVAFIVTRNKWRREMIRRGAARYNSETGKWEWGELPKKPKTWEVQ